MNNWPEYTRKKIIDYIKAFLFYFCFYVRLWTNLDCIVCGGGLRDLEADLLLELLGVHDQDLALRVAREYVLPSSTDIWASIKYLYQWKLFNSALFLVKVSFSAAYVDM